MNRKLLSLISVLAVFSIDLALAASLWRLWNWPVFAAVINGKISPLIPQVQVVDKTIRLFGQNADGLVYAIILAGAVIVLVVRPFQVPDRRFWAAILPCILIMVLAGLSTSWSVRPPQTQAQIFPFVVLTSAILILGLVSREKEILLALEIFSIGVIVASLFALFRYPTDATMTAQNTFAWRGIFLHKNFLGLAMAFANLVFLLRVIEFRGQHWILWLSRLGFYALALSMLLKSNAKTSLFAVIAAHLLLALGFAYLKWGHRLNRQHWILVTCAGLASLLLLWLGRRPILEAFERSTSLTGRIPLWSLLGQYIADRPLLGYGFGAVFWREYQGSIVLGKRWRPAHAHNGFIEVALSLGLLGTALVLILILETLILDLRHFLRVRLAVSTWPLLFWALIVVVSTSESLLVSNAYFFWTLLLLTLGFCLRAEFAPAGPGPAGIHDSAVAPGENNGSTPLPI